MRFERDDAKIGLLVFIAIAVFMALLFHRSLTAIVKKESIVKVRLENVSGLEVGTEVQLQGHRVGQVNAILLERAGEEYSFLITLGLRPDIVLWKGTLAVVSSSGLSSPFIDLDLPPLENRHSQLDADAVLIGETGASLGTLITEMQAFVQNLNGSLDDLKAQLKENGLGAVLDHPNVRRVLLDLDSTLLAFRKVAARGDALLTQSQGSVELLDKSLASLDKSSAMVEGLLDRRSGNLDAIIGNLDSLLQELQGVSTDMHKLLKDGGPEIEESLKALHRNLNATEELLEILKNKPSRVVWGTPTAAEKEAARKRVEANRKQDQSQPPEAEPATP
jgi:phospholipid/cholesterol/gamma-HCH transport system substrate-binding protein